MRTVVKISLLAIALSFGAANANAWYCTAQSKSGATGTGFDIFQSESEKAALKQCRLNAKGKRCVITSCW